MARQILVSVRSEDELGEIIPYLEKIAKLGMKIIFLVHSMKHEGSSEDDCVSLGSDLEPEGPHAQPQATRSLEPQHHKLLTKEKILPACPALLKMGVGISVDVYARSLTRAIGKYTARSAVDVLVMPAGNSLKILKFLHTKFSFRRLFQTTPASPLFVSYSQASGAAQPSAGISDAQELDWCRRWMPDQSKVARREALR
jgi:hypothetical protein